MAEYTDSLDVLVQELQTNLQSGLTAEQVHQKQEALGRNTLEENPRPPLVIRFFQQLGDFMVIILMIAAILSFVVALLDGSRDYIDSIIILLIVLANAILGVYQENKAENALDALKQLSSPTAKVLRDHRVQVLPSVELIPGDVILLEAGDFVPADGRIVESASLRCEESALTGESVPAEKHADAVVEEHAPLGDRCNMVYSGCSVTYGRAQVLVTATGMQTEIGKIAGMLRIAATELTPLQVKLRQLGKSLGIAAIVICILIFILGIFRGIPPITMFMTAVSLAVAVIPEGLTAVVTVVLAIGVQNMVKQNAIIRHLPAVETLGSASVICSDKTGTLTQNCMTVQKIWAVGEDLLDMQDSLPDKPLQILRLAALCNDSSVTVEDGIVHAIGDPTETAIVAAALKNQVDKSDLDIQFPRIAEIPFDSDRKRMSTVHTIGGKTVVIVKGGFDGITPLCPAIDRPAAEQMHLMMATEALRILAVAYKTLDTPPTEMTASSLENNLIFLGLIGMMDPPRPESAQAVALCHKAGIQTVMITGDHIVTAAAVAQQIGILDNGSQAITGSQLSKMSDDQLQAEIAQYRVFARVSPEDKIRIVQAWQQTGAVVAMTGDGVNDAPALSAADIGCAMGITGTDVAKGAADMVLTDDNFSTIVETVKSGRSIYENITKSIQFLLGSNLGEVFVVFVAMLLDWGTPLLAIHLLLINVVTDSLPALALGVEPTEADIMHRKPIPRGQGVFANGLGVRVILSGIMVGLLTLIGYYIGQNILLSSLYLPSHAIGRTMAFLVLALSQLSQAMNCRSHKSLFRIGFSSNPKMLWAVLGSAIIVVVICLFPPLERAFHMSNLSFYHWMIVLALSIAPIFIVEIVKLCTRKRIAGA